MSLEILRKIVEAHPEEATMEVVRIDDEGASITETVQKYPDDAFGYDGGERRVNQEGKPAPFLGRMKAWVMLAACNELGEKLDKKGKEIRLGSANALKEQISDGARGLCCVIVPIGYLRHLVKLAATEAATG